MNQKQTIKTLLALTFVAFFASCSVKKQSSSVQNTSADQSNIIGGAESTIEYQKENGVVGIYLMTKNSHGKDGGAICTGSLIKRNVVLTAAHCMVMDKGTKLTGAIIFFETDIEKVMGEVQAGNRANIREVITALPHSGYNLGQEAKKSPATRDPASVLATLASGDSSSSDELADEQDSKSANDLGLLLLESEAPADFKTANLPDASVASALKEGVALTLSGYGLAKYGYEGEGPAKKLVGSGDGTLRQVDGVVILGSIGEGKEMVLDQSHGKAACHGDSGGPAFLKVDSKTEAGEVSSKNYVVGITSRGEEPCDHYIVYTNSLAYLDWINAGVKQLEEKAVSKQP